eukprot:TRINITY_DN10045_c0_g1_i1.p4 TRINITY_DN10045_c0_g1~~TRINITY_DN10045_c0_g1_i1.p4  ORF type:complete len:125 (-),score=26.65 TRINITY_DN10045_c0_g1_i1:306-680(-)
MQRGLVGSEMCIRDRVSTQSTGVDDMISDGKRSIILKNGCKTLANVTGTGCMTSALCGAYAGSGDDYFIAVISAILSMGISGEISEAKNKEIGLGSFRVGIIDAISKLTPQIIEEKAKISIIQQ